MTFDRWQLGQVRISKVVEYGPPALCLPPAGILKNPPDGLVAAIPWLVPHWATPAGELLMSIQAFVLESEGQTILVDACVGNGKTLAYAAFSNARTDFLERLAAAGYPADRIDIVLCTHLHFDHVGWCTRRIDGAWVPTFPRARYLFAQAEWEHWQSVEKIAHGEVWAETLAPVMAAGRAELVPMDHALTKEVRLEPTPGHTPGHVSVRIESGGARGVITGDLCHHPAQLARPDLGSGADHDSAAAEQTRRAFFKRHGDSATTVFGTHFATPTAGRVVSDGAGWRFVVEG
jgi:glyoxylase-like metal-dependent hydrolase (beta-lactamase superfamily II)